MKLPAIQFYPGDWLRDPVAGCSLAAQGLWLRMMMLMHDSDRYGYLSCNGVPIPSEAIARRCSCDSTEQYTTLLAELDKAGVPSRTQAQVIYSRRMVRDAKKRAGNSERVAKFRSKSRNNNEDSNADVTQDVTDLYTPASSSVSSSSSPSGNKAERESGSHPKLDEVKAKAQFIGCSPEEAEKFWNHFESSGWIDKNGHEIVNWQAKLATWAANVRSKPLEQAHKGGPNGVNKPQTVGSLQIQFEAVQAEIKTHLEDKYVNLEWVKVPKTGHEDEVKQLRQKLKEIRSAIAKA